MTATEPASTLQLSFVLPGEWAAIDPQDEEGSRREIERIARRTAGSADDAALARRQVRESLTPLIAAARSAHAQRVFLCIEVTPGTPMPVSLTVHAPRELSMTPAVGTDPARVIEVLGRALRERDADGSLGAATATRLSIARSEIIRVHRLRTQTAREVVRGREVELVQRQLSAEYWFTVPQTKRVALASFATPLGDLPAIMLDFFDSIVRAARFIAGTESQSTPAAG